MKLESSFVNFCNRLNPDCSEFRKVLSSVRALIVTTMEEEGVIFPEVDESLDLEQAVFIVDCLDGSNDDFLFDSSFLYNFALLIQDKDFFLKELRFVLIVNFYRRFIV